MSEHTSKHDQHTQPNHAVINGKPTAPGHVVHYTGDDGNQFLATIDHLTPSGYANLTLQHNGHTHTSVPHSAVGGTHTWDHAPGQTSQGSQHPAQHPSGH